MLLRKAMGAVLLAVVLALPVAALAFDESKYPDMQGQWSRPRGVGIQWDPSITKLTYDIQQLGEPGGVS